MSRRNVFGVMNNRLVDAAKHAHELGYINKIEKNMSFKRTGATMKKPNRG